MVVRIAAVKRDCARGKCNQVQQRPAATRDGQARDADGKSSPNENKSPPRPRARLACCSGGARSDRTCAAACCSAAAAAPAAAAPPEAAQAPQPSQPAEPPPGSPGYGYGPPASHRSPGVQLTRAVLLLSPSLSSDALRLPAATCVSNVTDGRRRADGGVPHPRRIVPAGAPRDQHHRLLVEAGRGQDQLRRRGNLFGRRHRRRHRARPGSSTARSSGRTPAIWTSRWRAPA